MATIITDLGVATAYGYHKAGGGTLTEAEFEQKMVGITTAVDDAETAKDGAVAAKNAAEASAQSISQSAQQIATNTSDITGLKEDLNDKLRSYTNIDFPITNSRINASGSNTYDKTCKRSEFYPCSEGMTVEYYGMSFIYNNEAVLSMISFYDENKTFISGYTKIGDETKSTIGSIEAVAPEGTAYVRGSIKSDNTASDTFYLHVFDVEKTLDVLTDMPATVSDMRKNMDVLNSNMFKPVQKITVPSGNIVSGWKLDGIGTSVSASGYKILKYEVAEGDLIWIKASADSEGVYQFQNNKSVPSSGSTNESLIDEPCNTAVDGIVVVPEGATWLIISALSDNAESGVYTYQSRCDSIDTIENEIGIYRNTFNITAGSAHSSAKDAINVDIKQDESFYVYSEATTPTTFNLQWWARYSDGSASEAIGTLSLNTGEVYTANHDIEALGVYIGSQSIDNTVTITVKTNISLSAETSASISDVTSNMFNSAYTDVSIDEQVKEYCSLFVGSETVEPFLFFTDPHFFYGGDHFGAGSKKRFETYLPVIQKAYNSTPVNFCLCGGDWLTNNDTPAEACHKLGYMDAITRDFFKVYYPIIGNHDSNYQGVDDGDIPKTLSNQTLTNLMFRDFGRNYYTFKTQVSRFYVFDSGSDWATGMSEYRWEQVDWYAKQLKQNDDVHSVIGIHIVTNQTKASFEESPVIQAFANNLTLVAQAYNNRQSITLNSIAYDFTSATGKVEFVISGHTHWDGITTVNSIPTMMTDMARSGNVATFDLVYADYTNRVVKTVRVGTGENRSMPLT